MNTVISLNRKYNRPDDILGGGVRLLRRVSGSDTESATILIRGGPGTGKSVLATEWAVQVAHSLKADVLYVCTEILPTEVIVQHLGFTDNVPVVDLSTQVRKTTDVTTIVVGLTEPERKDLDGEEFITNFDFGGMLLDLFRISIERDYNPKVVIVDAFSGAADQSPTEKSKIREEMDGICKIAAEQGWVLILIEEGTKSSDWSYVVDTVVSLELDTNGARTLQALKNRFGPCDTTPKSFHIREYGVSL